ncbi:Phage protein [Enterococcus phage 156]|nr:Phage protein [Enterococcus phage 156]VDB76928.1 Phage protein [Enterococcus phage 156]
MLNSRGEPLLPINTQVRLNNFTFECNGRGRSPRVSPYVDFICRVLTF